MKYVSTKRVASKTQPGAVIVLKRINDRRRTRLAELQKDADAKQAPLFDEFSPLKIEFEEYRRRARLVNAAERKAAIDGGMSEKEALAAHPYGVVEFPKEKFKRWTELCDAIRKIEVEEQEPTAMRFVVAGIEAFAVDDVDVTTIDELLECEGAPDDFRAEILLEVKRELGLLPEEAQSLQLPSTSGAAVDGEKTTGTAPLVAIAGTTTGAAAESSTGPENAAVESTESTP